MVKGRVGSTEIDQEKVRKTRSDKRIRVNPDLSQETHRRLKRLALACGISKTELAKQMIELCCINTNIVQWYQNKYKADEFRITPVSNPDGTCDF